MNQELEEMNKEYDKKIEENNRIIQAYEKAIEFLESERKKINLHDAWREAKLNNIALRCERMELLAQGMDPNTDFTGMEIEIK